VRPPAICLLPLLVLSAAAAGHSDGSHLTEAVDQALVAATFGMPVVRLLGDSPAKRETGRRMADATIINAIVTQTLKQLVDSPRPHGGHQGFPSGHTSAAFATAVSLTAREPEALWWALPLAATAGWARVDLEQHTWGQVLAGAALGATTGYLCGTGQWRLFGRKGAPTAEGPSLLEPGGLPVAYVDPLPRQMQCRLVGGTRLWTTSF
jgi:membrane-associated phospholipid phosphatase